MSRPDKTIADFDPELLDAFHEYVHGRMDRRGFLAYAARFAVGGVTAAGLLGMLQPDYAQAQEIAADDPRISARYLQYPSPQDWQGYLVRPADRDAQALPAVLVIHENRGRNPYIEDVTRRLALVGYLALAPDALSPLGGWPGNDDDGRAMQRTLDPEEMMANWEAAIRFLKTHPQGNGRVGAVGFCYGGGVVNALAARMPDALDAGVPVYGRQAPVDAVAGMRTPLMFHNASTDTRILAGAPAYEAALEEAGVPFESFVYEGASHGFHNNSTPRYDEAAATLAWDRTLRWFDRHLS
ncbi:MAG: dienelactone hydrolase family protein [Pseudomonadales bacterium]|jgi:carboxymethylenebutenolidase|nr:dienelactone hydrolase family protein [Pseudomonadales bacterium]